MLFRINKQANAHHAKSGEAVLRPGELLPCTPSPMRDVGSVVFICFFWPLDVLHGSLMGMGNLTIDTALDGFLDPLSRCLDAESARRVTELRVGPAKQSGIDALAERANNGALSEEERAEYEAYINASDFIAISKPKAPPHLDSNQN